MLHNPEKAPGAEQIHRVLGEQDGVFVEGWFDAVTGKPERTVQRYKDGVTEERIFDPDTSQRKIALASFYILKILQPLIRLQNLARSWRSNRQVCHKTLFLWSNFRPKWTTSFLRLSRIPSNLVISSVCVYLRKECYSWGVFSNRGLKYRSLFKERLYGSI